MAKPCWFFTSVFIMLPVGGFSNFDILRMDELTKTTQIELQNSLTVYESLFQNGRFSNHQTSIVWAQIPTLILYGQTSL